MVPSAQQSTGFATREEFIEAAHAVFQETIINRENRRQFCGKPIFVDEMNWSQDKLDMFWHVSGLEENSEITIYPCSNDPILILCGENCVTREWSIETMRKQKAVCLYRAARICWINPILDLANANHANIKVWVERSRTFIRYQHLLDDYVIILEELQRYPNKYKLITAYPVFFIGQKRNFDRNYRNYINSTRGNTR